MSGRLSSWWYARRACGLICWARAWSSWANTCRSAARTNADIAAALGIGRCTVETHHANLMQKLGLRMQADLIRNALRRGILSLEQ